MKAKTTSLILFRNVLHSIAPNLADRWESIRAAEQYRLAIARTGFQMPLPSFIKRSIIKKYLLEHECRVLVETGTYLGDTPWAFRGDLDAIYSIELSPTLASIAQRRFRNYRHITIIEGDSGQKLRDIVHRLDAKVLFWLDGHYSAGITAQGAVDCPIFAELDAIFTACAVPAVILIDDAHCFGVACDYPTIPELKAFIMNRRSTVSITVENDIIRVI